MIARMSPQFATQDDDGGDGVPPPSQWIEVADRSNETEVPGLNGLRLDTATDEMLRRLRILFDEGSRVPLSTTDFHDLVCFALHRLLDQREQRASLDGASRGVSQAMALYLLTIHGPTYFSHAGLQCWITLQLKDSLDNALESLKVTNASLAVWMLSVGMVASLRTPLSQAFSYQAGAAALDLDVYDWSNVLRHLRAILWVENTMTEGIFLQAWQDVWLGTAT